MYTIVYHNKAIKDIEKLKASRHTVKIISMWTHYES
ncbi:MAG: hypothetical protein DDT39_00484 [Firmicutes bacterium]|nr:hypothetical protein [candidate division NPL-UPA2 bacterium]